MGTNSIPTGMGHAVIKGGELQWLDGAILWTIRIYDGKVTLTDLSAIDPVLQREPNSEQFYDSRYGLIVTTTQTTGLTSIFTGRIDRGAEYLADVVIDLCEKCGLTASQVDATDLETDVVYGLVSTTETTGKEQIELLGKAYDFIGREIDGKLVFSKKNSDPVRTIYEDELINVEESGSKGSQRFTRTRVNEFDLPRKVELTYYDLDRDFQEGHQVASRPIFPRPVIFSRKSQNINWPLVMIADQARQQAERLLYTTAVERESKKFSFLPKHMDLDPGDVVLIQMNDGTVFRERIEAFDIGHAFNSEVETSLVYPASFVSTITGSVGEGVPTQSIGAVVESYLFLMDIPLLSLVDEPAGSTYIPIYVSVGADKDGWSYSQVQRSEDSGDSYASWALQNVDIPWGKMTNALGIPPHGVFAVDDENEIKVKFRTSDVTLTSITDTEFLAGVSNLLLVDDEIIQYRDAVKTGDYEWTLSYLRRGHKGTEWAAATHDFRPTVIALDGSAIEVMPIDYTDVGTAVTYRAVSKDQFQDQADDVAFTMEGNAIRPWAPSSMAAVLNGSDIDVTWERRERLYTEDWLQSADGSSIPDSEPTESYNVYVLTAAHTGPDAPTSWVRKSTVTTPAWTYTSVDQTTDGFDPNTDTLHLAVTKVSSRIGDGFPSPLSIDLTA
jgi:hypothetical protein